MFSSEIILKANRGPVIWNFVNKIAKVPESLASFKNTIRKSHVELNAFSFNKEAIVITKKCKDFIYFWLAEYYNFT